MLVQALDWGIDGFLTHEASIDLIKNALLSAMAGGSLLSKSAIEHAFKTNTPFTRQLDRKNSPREAKLTPRELDVLRLLARGMSNRSLCQELQLAEVTVKKHVQSIIAKLDVKDRTQAALRGVGLGLID